MRYPNADLIPADVKAAIDRYVASGCPTGEFLQAVLENNLMQAIGQADEDNLEALPHICCYIYNSIPSSCHGSPEKYENWIAEKNRERVPA